MSTYTSTSPDSPFSPASSSGFPFGNNYITTQNIDDIIYRYSAESDRGTPTVGIYAQDGIWDDDDLSSEAATVRRGSGSTFGHHSAKVGSASASVSGTGKGETSRSNRTSVKARSRSGTVGSAIVDKDRSMWSWNKRSGGVVETLPDARVEVIKQAPVPVPTQVSVQQGKTLEKKKSKSLLRGKGRRGELSVNVSPVSIVAVG